MHFQDFQSIDWNSEVKGEKCTIIIAPIVLDELDEKKIGTNRIGNKARQALKNIENLIEEAALNKNVGFEVIIEKPLQKVYDEYDLNFKEQDHRLIASMIDFKIKRQVSNVLLCTNDIGPRLRAKQHGIASLKLSDKYLLPVQESEIEKKIRKLEQENIRLKNKIPKVALTFDNSQEYVKIKTKNFELRNYEDFKTESLKILKQKFPYMEHVDSYKNPLIGLTSALAPDSNQINSYNEKLDTYFKEYEYALEQVYEREKRKKLTFEIKLQIINSGTIPAEYVNIHLHFPDGFKLLESEELDDSIELPELPYKPKHRLDFGHHELMSNSIISPNLNLGTKFSYNKPKIKKTNSYNVDYYRKQIKHGYSERLEDLSIIYDSYIDIKNFKLDYIISAGNMPDKIEGKLNIIFDKE